jgi:hypothetical protein
MYIEHTPELVESAFSGICKIEQIRLVSIQVQQIFAIFPRECNSFSFSNLFLESAKSHRADSKIPPI